MNGVEYVRDLCKKQGVPISRLEKELGFSNGYFNPKKMEYLPYDRAVLVSKRIGGDIKKMIDIKDDREESYPPYYLNDETRAIAQAAFENPDMRSLFDIGRKMTPERLKAHLELMRTLYDIENGNDGTGC